MSLTYAYFYTGFATKDVPYTNRGQAIFEIVSTETDEPPIGNRAGVGDTLRIDLKSPDPDGTPFDFPYNHVFNWIDKATNTVLAAGGQAYNYTIQADDINKIITARVIYTDSKGFNEEVEVNNPISTFKPSDQSEYFKILVDMSRPTDYFGVFAYPGQKHFPKSDRSEENSSFAEPQNYHFQILSGFFGLERPGEMMIPVAFPTRMGSVFLPQISGYINWGDGSNPELITASTLENYKKITFPERESTNPGYYDIDLFFIKHEYTDESIYEIEFSGAIPINFSFTRNLESDLFFKEKLSADDIDDFAVDNLDESEYFRSSAGSTNHKSILPNYGNRIIEITSWGEGQTDENQFDFIYEYGFAESVSPLNGINGLMKVPYLDKNKPRPTFIRSMRFLQNSYDLRYFEGDSDALGHSSTRFQDVERVGNFQNCYNLREFPSYKIYYGGDYSQPLDQRTIGLNNADGAIIDFNASGTEEIHFSPKRSLTEPTNFITAKHQSQYYPNQPLLNCKGGLSSKGLSKFIDAIANAEPDDLTRKALVYDFGETFDLHAYSDLKSEKISSFENSGFFAYGIKNLIGHFGYLAFMTGNHQDAYNYTTKDSESAFLGTLNYSTVNNYINIPNFYDDRNVNLPINVNGENFIVDTDEALEDFDRKIMKNLMENGTVEINIDISNHVPGKKFDLNSSYLGSLGSQIFSLYPLGSVAEASSVVDLKDMLDFESAIVSENKVEKSNGWVRVKRITKYSWNMQSWQLDQNNEFNPYGFFDKQNSLKIKYDGKTVSVGKLINNINYNTTTTDYRNIRQGANYYTIKTKYVISNYGNSLTTNLESSVFKRPVLDQVCKNYPYSEITKNNSNFDFFNNAPSYNNWQSESSPHAFVNRENYLHQKNFLDYYRVEQLFFIESEYDNGNVGFAPILTKDDFDYPTNTGALSLVSVRDATLSNSDRTINFHLDLNESYGLALTDSNKDYTSLFYNLFALKDI